MVYPAIRYSGRTLPSTRVAGLDVGNMDSEQVRNEVISKIDQTIVTLTHDEITKEVPLTSMGLAADLDALAADLTEHSLIDLGRPWFSGRDYSLPTTINDQKLNAELVPFEDATAQAPVNASYKLVGDKVNVIPGQPGRGIDDKYVAETIQKTIESSLNNLLVALRATSIEPDITDDDISQHTNTLEQMISHNIQIDGSAKPYVPSKSLVLRWSAIEQVENGDQTEIKISLEAIKKYVSDVAAAENVQPTNEVIYDYLSGRASQKQQAGKVGRKVVNADDVAEQIYTALVESRQVSVGLEFEEIPFTVSRQTIDDRINKFYSYDVAVWGSVGVDLSSFKAQASETLNSSLGWARGGVGFSEVPSNGSFTLVLASPARVNAASPGCDAYYSCRVGRYVIINADRWMGATPAWNNAGGSLRDYRHMLINHETGHWLGFGHRNCSGSGALAPVMQQQSIGLQGCKFNPWPLAEEIAGL